MKSLADVQRFAYRVAGPNDLCFNLVINSIIPALVYWGMSEVPLWGSRSLAIVGLPMLTLMPLLTTYFGYRRTGVEAAAAAREEGAPPFAWQARAWRAGFIRAACGLTCGALLLLAWTSFGGTTSLPKWLAVTIIAIVSAIGAYFLHASAVVDCFRLWQRKRESRRNVESTMVEPPL